MTARIIVAVWLASWLWIIAWWITERNRDREFHSHVDDVMRVLEDSDIPAEDRPDWGRWE